MVYSNKNSNKMKLGFSSILALVIGAQLGSGIFMLPHHLSQYGIYSLIGWCISGMGALSLGILFTKLSNIFSHGGPPRYILHSLGRLAGFIAAWTYWTVSWFSTLPVIITIAVNISDLTGINNILFLEILFLTIFTIINCYSMKHTAYVEIVLTSIKMILLLIIPLIFLFYGQGNNHFLDIDIIQAIRMSSVMTVWGFIGLEIATVPDANTKSVNKAIFLGILIVLLIYILNTYSILHVLSQNELNTLVPYSMAMNKCIGNHKIMSAVIALVCMGTLNSWILATSQMSYNAAQENLFPKIFAIKTKHSVPIYGTIIQYVLLLFLLLFMTDQSIHNQISNLIDISVLAYIIIFFVSIIVYIKESLYKENIIAPILSLLFCLLIFTSVDIYNILISLVIPFSGFIIYIIMSLRAK